jgi:hypothetical protein
MRREEKRREEERRGEEREEESKMKVIRTQRGEGGIEGI